MRVEIDRSTEILGCALPHVGEASGNVDTLNPVANNIGYMVEAIASQTNLLALNATRRSDVVPTIPIVASL